MDRQGDLQAEGEQEHLLSTLSLGLDWTRDGLNVEGLLAQPEGPVSRLLTSFCPHFDRLVGY